MIYIVGNKIKSGGKGFWNEGSSYQKSPIYRKIEGSLPPVNYDEHILKPHSLTHAESARHTQNEGSTLDKIIENHPEYFAGECLVIKFRPEYKNIGDNLFLHEISKEEIYEKIELLSPGKNKPQKVLITTEDYPVNEDGYHAENYILILSRDAAEYLYELPEFHLFGTTWKSTDYQPGKFERPIHDIIFRKGVIFELLNLNQVPEGYYFFSGMPLYLDGVSESPVTPLLITM